MKIKYLLSILINIIFLISLVNAQTVSHPASQVTPGTFSNGDFTFIGDVTIDNTAFSKLIIDSGPLGYSSVDFYDSGAPDWGLGKDSSGNFYIDQSGVTPPYITILPGGNVGIGTTNPGTKLDVVGGHIRTDNSLLGGVGNVGFAGIGFGSDMNTGLWRPGADQLGFITGGVDRIRIDASGNVGIGTTTVSQKLHIFGGDVQIEDIAPVIYFRENDQIDPAGWWRLAGDGDQLSFRRRTAAGTWTGEKYPLILYRSSGDVRIGEGSGYVYYDNSAGNVGIGTTIPLGKLHVNLDAVDVGSARFFTPVLPSGSGSGASNFNQLKLGYGDGSFQSAAIRFNRDDVGGNLLQLFHWGESSGLVLKKGGNVGIGSVSPGEKLDVAGNIKASGTICDGSGNCIGSGSLWTDSLTNTYLTQTTDNVGIGTSNPGAKLHAVGNANTLRLEGTDHTFIEFYPDGPLTRKAYFGFPNAAENNIRIKNEIATGHIILEPGANVGIGMTGPNYKLEVLGRGLFRNDNWPLGVSNSAGTSLAWLGTSNNDLIFYNAAGAETARITSGGNVGIGTASPSLQLEVKQSSALASAGIELENSAGTTTQLRMRGASESGGSRFSIVQNGNDAFTIGDTGNVGIGTTNPSTFLQIEGDGIGNYDSPDLHIGGTEGNIRLGAANSDSGFQIFTDSAYPHQLIVQTELNPDAADYEMFAVKSSGFAERFSVIHAAAAGYASQFYDSLAVGAVGDNSPTLQFVDLGLAGAGDLWISDDLEVTDSAYFGGNVGIGTTSPGEKLHVVGDAKFVSGSDVTGTLGSGIIYTQNPGGTLGLHIDVNEIQTVGGPLYLQNEGAQDLNVGAGDLFVETSGGNVGIGTTAPGYAVGAKLDVRGDVLAKSKLYLANSGFNAGDDDTFILDGSTSGKLKFSYRWAGGPTTYDRMIIDNNGNVGIGSVSPGEKLDVAGNIKASGTICDGSGNCIGSGSLWTDSLTNTYLTQTGDNVGIGTTLPGAKLEIYGTNADLLLKSAANDIGDIVFQESDGNQKGRIWTGSGAADEKLFLSTGDNTADITIDSLGKVGIGTTGPLEPLHVFKGGTAGAQTTVLLLHSDTSNRPLLQFSETAGGGLASGMSIEYDGRLAGADNLLNINNVGGSPVMTIKSGGNVGIGTTNPQSPLHIDGFQSNGEARFLNSQAGGVGAGGFKLSSYGSNGAVSELAYIDMSMTNGAIGSESGIITFGTENSGALAERMRITSAGTVGIGTTGPGEVLELQASNAKPALRLHVPGVTEYNIGIVGTTLHLASNRPGGDIGADTRKFVVDGNGNVGIGTTGPGSKLQVSGGHISILETSGPPTFFFKRASFDSPYGTIQFQGNTGTVKWEIGSNQAVGPGIEINEGASANNRVYIAPGGNVGIGTTNPIALLQVNGDPGTDILFVVSAGAGEVMRILESGNVGIGTPQNPNAKLDVSGNIKAGTASGIGSFLFNSFGNPDNSDDLKGADESDRDVYIEDDLEVDGQIFVTGGYVVNSDIAEVLLTKKGRENVLCSADTECWKERKIELESYERELEFGDLVCGSNKIANVIEKCTEANSKLVVGFVSNTSAFNMGNNLRFGYPIAVAGVVWSKVTNANGNINPGDLLVSAEKDGYAMKNDNPKDGTVVGKAFDFCYEEECSILVFVALS